MRLMGLACALALAATSAWAAPGHWIGSWAASPAPPMAPPPGGRIPGTPSFNNQTIVQTVRLSGGGQRLRVRLSNEYGPEPLAVGAARVALVAPGGGVIAGSERPLAFSGQAGATIPAGAPLISDPVDLPTKPLARLQVRIFFAGDTHGCTCHMSGLESLDVAPGDATAKPPPSPAQPGRPQYRAFLSAVEVETAAPPAPVVVAFGDSITDGFTSTVGGDQRWPDRLAERLAARFPGRAFGVNNAGIGGNQVLATGRILIFGQSALTRFDRDVLSVPGATHVVVLEGVNDLGVSHPPAEALIAGYRQLIARAHAHDLKVIGATILPYGGAGYFSAAGEAERQKVNAWIRTGRAFDGVIDFDATIRDPAKPDHMRAELQSGDWLHPNDAGYRAMAEAVVLSVFR